MARAYDGAHAPVEPGVVRRWSGGGPPDLVVGLFCGPIDLTEDRTCLDDPLKADFTGVVIESPDCGRLLEEDQLALHGLIVPRGCDS